MSSELIGELGQVGLKIGEPTIAPLTSTTNDIYTNDEKKKPKLSSHRPKKFRQAWMMFDIFKDWLRPHTSPEFAMCIVCNRVIKAGKSELEKHAAGKRHQMLRCTAPSSTTVLLGQELISQSELPVNININGKSELEKHTAGKRHQMLRCTAPSSTTVLLGQELITQSELPVSININGDSGGGGGASTGATTVDEYGGMTCMDTASYNNFAGESGGNDTFHQAVTRQQPPAQPTPPQEITTKAIVSKASPSWKATAIVNGHVTRLDLSDYRGRYLILFFYPQDFNRVCASEINSLSDRIGEFRAAQTEIVACSVDSHLCHLAWSKLSRQEGGVGNPKIPLLADPTHTIAKDYGVLIPEKGHTLRATFITDKRGILRVMNIYDSLIGRGIDELLRSVRALQYSDETEEAVPADWTSPRSLQCKDEDIQAECDTADESDEDEEIF